MSNDFDKATWFERCIYAMGYRLNSELPVLGIVSAQLWVSAVLIFVTYMPIIFANKFVCNYCIKINNDLPISFLALGYIMFVFILSVRTFRMAGVKVEHEQVRRLGNKYIVLAMLIVGVSLGLIFVLVCVI